MITTAVIGTGFIGPSHIEALRRLGTVEVIALADVDQETADKKAAQLGIPNAYGNYRQILDDPAIQIVHICTPNHLHLSMC
jgi:predicted dehydrogenase